MKSRQSERDASSGAALPITRVESHDLPGAKHAHAVIHRVGLHYVEMGEGPAVVFLHGFPELWFSWRHQMPAVAAAGYRAIALDMRGHGRSDAPPDIDDYTVLHTVGDVIGLMDELGLETAVLVGHDAGTTAAYHAALMRPDRIRGVMGLSVPFAPRGPRSTIELLSEGLPAGFYMNWFQHPGLAEADFEADVAESLRRLLYANSGEHRTDAPFLMVVPEGGTLTQVLPAPSGPLGFMSEAEFRLYVAEYRRTGFRGGLNGYRVFQKNWVLTAAWAGMHLPVPAAYVGGTCDTVVNFLGNRARAEAMSAASGGPPAVFVEGAGHWIQNERPAEVNKALLEFLARLS
jgi:pimeloyl-ACP methyl ester carboxylesterase